MKTNGCQKKEVDLPLPQNSTDDSCAAPIDLDRCGALCGPTQDYFSPDPGKFNGPINCGVCNSVMDEKRNVMGPRGYVMAVVGNKELHDIFSCPHRNEIWHKQALKLRQMARETPSSRLATMFVEESDEIIKTRKSTKEEGMWSI